MSTHGIPPRVDWAMLRKEGPSACARCRDPSPGWHGVRKAIRINSIQIFQEGTQRHAIRINSIRIPPKKTCASCYPALVNITLRMITYPIRIWCSDGKHWLKWASLATAHVPPLSDGVSGHLCHGFQRTLLNLRIALVIKKLSKHQNLTQFD